KADGRDYIQLTIGKEGSDSYDNLTRYRENFHQLLRGATKEVREIVTNLSRDWTPKKPKYTKAFFEKVKRLREEGCTYPEVCDIVKKEDNISTTPQALETRISLLGEKFARGKKVRPDQGTTNLGMKPFTETPNNQSQ